MGSPGDPVRILIWAVMLAKESKARLAVVNPTIPTRVQTRNRSDRRLQSMTLGAAVLGLAATGAFGYAAALTYTGTANAANATPPPTHFGSDQGGDDQPLLQQPFTGAGSAGQGANVSPLFGGQRVTPPTTSVRRSHVTSGGS